MSDLPENKRLRFTVENDDKKELSAPASADISIAKASMATLPDAVLQVSFSFLGKGHYRYVAGTCHRFRDIYSIKHEAKTSWRNASDTVDCAALCLKDEKEKPEEQRNEGLVLLRIAKKACGLGQLDVLKWARIHGCLFDYWCFVEAAESGQVRVFEWADSNGIALFPEESCESATMCGKTNVLQYIWERHPVEWGFHCPLTAEYGQVEVLDWMKRRSMLCGKGPEMFYEAASNGHMNVLEWLLENEYDPRDELVVGAAASDRKDILLWARDRGISWTAAACTQAALGGNLSLLQWLREHGCPWDGNVIRSAGLSGYDHVVAWARENGCPSD